MITLLVATCFHHRFMGAYGTINLPTSKTESPELCWLQFWWILPPAGRDGWVERIKICLLAAVCWSALVFEFLCLLPSRLLELLIAFVRRHRRQNKRHRTQKQNMKVHPPCPTLLFSSYVQPAPFQRLKPLHLSSLHYSASDGCSYGAYDGTRY